MNIEVKLINGYWMAVINGKTEKHNELTPTLKKIFMILLSVEIIIAKYNL